MRLPGLGRSVPLSGQGQSQCVLASCRPGPGSRAAPAECDGVDEGTKAARKTALRCSLAAVVRCGCVGCELANGSQALPQASRALSPEMGCRMLGSAPPRISSRATSSLCPGRRSAKPSNRQTRARAGQRLAGQQLADQPRVAALAGSVEDRVAGAEQHAALFTNSKAEAVAQQGQRGRQRVESLEDCARVPTSRLVELQDRRTETGSLLGARHLILDKP